MDSKQRYSFFFSLLCTKSTEVDLEFKISGKKNLESKTRNEACGKLILIDRKVIHVFVYKSGRAKNSTKHTAVIMKCTALYFYVIYHVFNQKGILYNTKTDLYI